MDAISVLIALMAIILVGLFFAVVLVVVTVIIRWFLGTGEIIKELQIVNRHLENISNLLERPQR